MEPPEEGEEGCAAPARLRPCLTFNALGRIKSRRVSSSWRLTLAETAELEVTEGWLFVSVPEALALRGAPGRRNISLGREIGTSCPPPPTVPSHLLYASARPANTRRGPTSGTGEFLHLFGRKEKVLPDFSSRCASSASSFPSQRAMP